MPGGRLYAAAKANASWWYWALLLTLFGMSACIISVGLSLFPFGGHYEAALPGQIYHDNITFAYVAPLACILYIFIAFWIFKTPFRVSTWLIVFVDFIFVGLHWLATGFVDYQFVHHCRSGVANFCFDGVARYASYNWFFGSHNASAIAITFAAFALYFFHTSTIANEEVEDAVEALTESQTDSRYRSANRAPAASVNQRFTTFHDMPMADM